MHDHTVLYSTVPSHSAVAVVLEVYITSSISDMCPRTSCFTEPCFDHQSIIRHVIWMSCKVSTCAARAAPPFGITRTPSLTRLTCLTCPARLASLLTPARSRTSVRSPQYPSPSLACQRHLLPRLFSLFSLKLTSFRASRDGFLFGLPCQVPRALYLTDYLCALVCVLPRVPLIRLLRRDLLFLSLAPSRRS